MEEILVVFAGTLFGLLVGVIPSAGATTGLVALFGFVDVFNTDPYLAVIFCMAMVASSTTGDTYSGVLLGIPGANSAAATMVDGFPLAQQGQATRAITAAIITSTANGLIWGVVALAMLPLYTGVILILGIPELWGFTILALATVGFVTGRSWKRGIIAVFVGLWVGMIGTDPATNADRWTFGWDYLGDGIQLMPLVAGLFAIPELISGLRSKKLGTNFKDQSNQTYDGIRDALILWKDSLRGGVIGAFVGLLPGLGGAVADWMAYASTVATNPKENFGQGNIRGVVGAEGANNAQKATSMVPTVLFGIPGAPFAAVLIALFTYFGFELGTPELANDERFFNSLVIGFISSTVLVAVICLYFTKYICAIAQISFKYYAPIILLAIIWSCVQYTGGWEDYLMLGLCSVVGLLCKRYGFSRPALLMGFILSGRVESLTLQTLALYNINLLIQRPIFLLIMFITLAIAILGIIKGGRLNYV